MQLGTTENMMRGGRILDNPSSAPVLIENPLFEQSGDRNASRSGSRSAPVSRQVSEQHNRGTVRSVVRGSIRRSKTVKEYLRKSTASFFGIDNETEQDSYLRWTERRRRLLSKKYGQLKKDHYLQSSDENTGPTELPHLASYPARDSFMEPSEMRLRTCKMDAIDSVDGISNHGQMYWQHRQKEPVYKLMWDGLNFIVTNVARRMSSARPRTSCAHHRPLSYAASTAGSVFYEESHDSGLPPSQIFSNTDQLVDEVFFDNINSSATNTIAENRDSWTEKQSESLTRSAPVTAPVTDFVDYARPVKHTWHRPSSLEPQTSSSDVGMKRIWNKLLDHAFDNSNRRQYGMGVVGRLLKHSFRQDRITSDVKQQLDDLDDHRPFFTYWVTTVQILVTIISLAVYGFGPVGFHKTQRSSLVLVTSLSLQEVDYFEPDNFWIGPRAADLVHLGAKFTPCMRKDKKIHDDILKSRETERKTACCIRNDQSGCVQTSRDKCSEVISTWRKWDINQPGPPRWISDPKRIGIERSSPQRRLSGSVCGQDPRYCEEPASAYPYEWPDDITKWPVCRHTVMSEQAAEAHMSCEVIGRPCCIGIYGQCHITTKEYCDFVQGFFHEEAALCSQVSCLDDVCGMIPFYNPEVPDQFYRLWTSLFLHAGILHLLVTVIVQYFIMRDVEKLIGPLRMAIIYIMSGVAGNLASAIFVPYRAEVGPAGSQFGLLACLFVEVIHCWQMLKRPGIALLQLGGVTTVLFLIGLLPWVDNYAHLFGFIFGFLMSYALLPFVSFGTYDRTTKIILIWVCLIVVTALFVGLIVLFYVHPIYECSFCKYFNCIPLTRDFCENQDINFTRQEY